MKIGFISKKFEPKTGKSKHILDIAKKLKSFEIVLVTNKCILNKNDEIPKNLKIIKVRSSSFLFYFKYKKILSLLKDCKHIILFGGLVASLFVPFFSKYRKIIFDIKDLPTEIKELKYMNLFEIIKSFSFVLNVDDIIGFFLGKRVLKKLLENKNVIKIIIPTEGLEKRFDKSLKNKIIYIPYGVDMKKYRPLIKNRFRKKLGFKNDEFIVFFYGRAVMLRGIGDLIKSFNNLRKTVNSKLVLNLLPDINLSDIRNLVNKSPFKKDIILNIGYVPNNEEFMGASDVAVFPFKTTGCVPPQPLTLLEAMACEKTVISTKIGFLNEIIENGKNGFLVNPSSQKDLTRVLEMLAKNPKLIKKTSREAYKSMKERYDLEKISYKYEKILK